jgi:exopolysaccharide biosynthesis WecB/TagA/CpsF family protein
MNKTDVAGLKVDPLTKQELLTSILRRIAVNQKTWVTTVYSEFLYAGFRDTKIIEMLNTANFAVADGIAIFWAKKFLEIPLTAKSYGGKIFQALWQIKYSLAAIIFYPKWIKNALPEKIVGADLIWDLAKMASDNHLSIFLLGGFGNTPELAKQKLISQFPNISISVSNKNPNEQSVVEDINRVHPDMLFVAYGPIKQEKWIAENLQKLNIKVAIGVGGSFDYIAGKKSAPPKFVRYSGLEWLWRLITQPHRLKRIINATFGLVSGLWHYKVFHALPLRQNVAAVILNQNNEILLCQRNPKDFFIDIITSEESLKRNNYWQLPQGGIDAGEGIVEAGKREAWEETGLENLELVKISPKTNTYVWNNAVRKFWKNRTHRNMGQTQHIVYFKFSGNDAEIKIDNKEFINFKWVKPGNLLSTIHPERLPLGKIVTEDLNNG